MPLWMCVPPLTWLASRPSGDTVPEQIKNLQVDLVSITFVNKQVAEAVIVVINVGQT